MKKRILAALIVSALMISAAACGNNEKKPDTTTAAPNTSAADSTDSGSTEKTYKAAADIANDVLAEMPIISAKNKTKDKLNEPYFPELDINTIVDSEYYICASGAYPDELGIFRFDSEASAKAAVTVVMDRLIEWKKTCGDYPVMKDEMYKFDDAVVAQNGVWVYYILTSNNARAEEIIKGAIG